jgi:hypothetical protein
MKRSIVIIALLVLTSNLTVLTAGVSKKGGASAQEQFVGTWELVSIESRGSDGEWAPAEGRLGAHPMGMIIYDAAGHMAVQIMSPERPTFSSNDLSERTAEELAGAIAGYVAYFGTYDVDEGEGFVIHHREGHLRPNQVMVDAKRFFEFAGNELTLTVAPAREVRLTWRRIGG